MIFPTPIFAQGVGPLAGEVAARTTYELARLRAYDDERWFLLAIAGMSAGVLAFVWYIYHRDGAELRPSLSTLLIVLRLTAFVGLLLFFLHPEKRTEREVTHNSRLLVLVDVSQSMGLHDSDASAVPATPSRMDQIVGQLAAGRLLPELRKVHDVEVLRFDREVSRIVSLPKVLPDTRQGTVAEASEESIDWKNALLPKGAETRLGEALRRVINDERGTPVSGIVVITDGGQNAGIEPASAVALAKDAKIPVYTIGIGSDKRPVNVRISDFVAPARAYPGDAYQATAYVQAQGLANRAVTVELFSRNAINTSDVGSLEGSQRVALGGDGEVVPVTFELTSDAPGRRTLQVRVSNLSEDRNLRDNKQEVDVEIVDREIRVMLIASGPSREYRFLRNLLHRDKDVVVDVWLQSAGPGISQDAHEILDQFPETKEELYRYDCIVAFDPDWTELDLEQVDLLERWVAEEAGGMIVVAGPIHTSNWTRSSDMAKIAGLYPVEFQRRLSILDDAQFGSKTVWPIEFTREGVEAEFLWIADTATENQAAWASFPGVYGYYAVKGPKPGATVYARYSNPEAGLGEEMPVYFASHFYGSGRVFYSGSGEMWRLRALDEAYFEQFYTKLIRYVSQGRLLRGSTQGVLLVQRERYLLGDTVVVRAQLSDAQHEPLEVSSVTLDVTRPDSTTQSIRLMADATRKGMYAGQFTALQEGAYRIDLSVPETLNDQLTRHIQVKVPDLERENPQRNDALLSEIATSTGGLYYVGIDSALGHQSAKPLVGQLRDRTEVTKLIGAPDKSFEEDLMKWLLAAVCGALCIEWLIRRLSKLA